MKINKILVFILAIFIPYLLLMTGVRLVMTPAFPAMEYKRAGFPQDPYGFTIQERTKWSDYAVSYLTNDAGIEYLENLQDLTGQKMFAPDELTHMEDVKEVVTISSTVWYVLGGVSIAILLWFVIMRQWDSIRKAFNAGGWITVGLLSALLVFLAVSFDQLFVYFHRLFFEDGTWTFSQSSTLIRLFPFEFWRDAFVLVIGFALLVGVLFVIVTHKRKSR
ncbi:MAG: TIGR01906 family membrane protein [Chloroflexi bacterium]|jgi:integral membrane protein (TIGR01906 family)|nr:TIGR01906 family membrane protein [Chloroflexota bacterium]